MLTPGGAQPSGDIYLSLLLKNPVHKWISQIHQSVTPFSNVFGKNLCIDAIDV